MINLILSILFSTALQVIFRYFGRYRVDNQTAISINYLICVSVGLISSSPTAYLNCFTPQNWNWITHSLLLGILFIIVFIAMARCAQELSISIGTVASKMGVLFPVLYGWLFLRENLTPMLAAGIAFSLLSIFSIVPVGKRQLLEAEKHSLLPLLVFVGSGIIDTNLKILEAGYFTYISPHFIVTTLFLGAFLAGTVSTLRRLYRNRALFNWKNLIGGIILGVPNYFSIYFLMKALNQDGFPSVFVLPLNNIAVVLCSVMVSLLLFRERFTARLMAGVVLAVLAISLIGFS